VSCLQIGIPKTIVQGQNASGRLLRRRMVHRRSMKEKADREGTADEFARFVWTGRAGEFVFRRGDSSADLFIVEQGEIELLIPTEGGSERRLSLVRAGEFFGEAALLEGRPREVSARVTRDCRLLRLDPATLSDVIGQEPDLAVALLRGLSRRLREREQAAPVQPSKPTATPAPSAPDAAPKRQPIASPGSFSTVSAPRFIEVRSGRVFACPDSVGPGGAGPGTGTSPDASLVDIEITIGRHDRRTGRAPGIDFTAVDRQRSLSRRHARLRRRGNDVFLQEESGVHNGTFVNGQRLLPGAEIQLQDGDHVRFAMVDTIFRQTREHGG
jgi:CRP-like cAMP-binding protein